MTNTPYPKTAKMLDELEAIARARMADNGGEDYVYAAPGTSPHDGLVPGNTCLYVHTGEGEDGSDVPGCIIGTWLHEYKHIPLEKLERQEGTGAWAVLQRVLLQGERDVEMTRIADEVQASQDTGHGWLAAVQAGRDMFAREVEDRARTFSG